MGLIYLDYAATTPLSQNVKKTMLKSISDDSDFFNSGSSTYEQALLVRDKIEQARVSIADSLSVLPREIIFTSGATESNNLAIKGTAYAYQNKGKHIITSKVEHKAVLDVCGFLETKGFEVTYLDVDGFGQIDLEQIKKAIKQETILISLMAVNNELGTLNNLREIGKLTKQSGIIFHVDAAQGYGKIDIDINDMNIDLLSVSGHKIYAPKGVGFLYVRSKRPKVKLEKQIHGGAQEFNLRAGTLANYQIFALAEAVKEMFANRQNNLQYIKDLRDTFLDIIKEIDDIKINTKLDNSYPGILSITFVGVKGETLLAMLGDICMSMGSACNSQAVEPSHVLVAIGLSADQAESTIRISFGLHTSREQVVLAAKILIEKVKLLRAISPQGEENV
ncbi:beta-eliminating lyase family protein [Francisella philomiragia]|uniref:cysteine desulfurase family protein n=1 Tax=Francisella philomiragia TaxID=28110 RepID=UPI0005A5744B|nr:cysteine desulfurase family protein [Francisella philomiragia]AJI56366.1 beta-eliminating lyase family protein [Francisella philomiragia]